MIMRIKELREERGLTQTQLANSMGVIQNSISQWENEVVLPRTRDLPLLADVLGVTIGELFATENSTAS